MKCKRVTTKSLQLYSYNSGWFFNIQCGKDRLLGFGQFSHEADRFSLVAKFTDIDTIHFVPYSGPAQFGFSFNNSG